MIIHVIMKETIIKYLLVDSCVRIVVDFQRKPQWIHCRGSKRDILLVHIKFDKRHLWYITKTNHFTTHKISGPSYISHFEEFMTMPKSWS